MANHNSCVCENNKTKKFYSLDGRLIFLCYDCKCITKIKYGKRFKKASAVSPGVKFTEVKGGINV